MIIDPKHNPVELCWDDILLVPRYSELNSRTTPDLSCEIGHVKLQAPLMSAAMDTVTGRRMLMAMDEAGGVGILSRYVGIDPGVEICKQLKKVSRAKEHGTTNVGCAIGIRYRPEVMAQKLLDSGCDIICIDVQHADHKGVHEAVKKIVKLKNKYKFVLMVGNVCTGRATQELARSGADVVKVGIGPGAACTTRLVTGFGRTQLVAVQECSDAAVGEKIQIIADGGFRKTGDIVKALWAGADACMLGFMLAGTDCAPDVEGHKIYRGMSTRSASGRSDIAPEGVEMEVEYQGRTNDVLEEYLKGIKAGLAMGGAFNIEMLRECDYRVVSPTSYFETHPMNGDK
jgi:IMP dehydrogenase